MEIHGLSWIKLDTPFLVDLQYSKMCSELAALDLFRLFRQLVHNYALDISLHIDIIYFHFLVILNTSATYCFLYSIWISSNLCRLSGLICRPNSVISKVGALYLVPYIASAFYFGLLDNPEWPSLSFWFDQVCHLIVSAYIQFCSAGD